MKVLAINQFLTGEVGGTKVRPNLVEQLVQKHFILDDREVEIEGAVARENLRRDQRLDSSDGSCHAGRTFRRRGARGADCRDGRGDSGVARVQRNNRRMAGATIRVDSDGHWCEGHKLFLKMVPLAIGPGGRVDYATYSQRRPRLCE